MRSFLFLFSVLFLTSCPINDEVFNNSCDVQNPIENLVWLKEIKTSFEQSSSATKRSIIQYKFKNKIVFLVDSCNNCPDNLTTLYNCEGVKICEFGGIAGLNTCSGFDKEAKNKIILWEN